MLLELSKPQKIGLLRGFGTISGLQSLLTLRKDLPNVNGTARFARQIRFCNIKHATLHHVVSTTIIPS